MPLPLPRLVGVDPDGVELAAADTAPAPFELVHHNPFSALKADGSDIAVPTSLVDTDSDTGSGRTPRASSSVTVMMGGLINGEVRRPITGLNSGRRLRA